MLSTSFAAMNAPDDSEWLRSGLPRYHRPLYGHIGHRSRDERLSFKLNQVLAALSCRAGVGDVEEDVRTKDRWRTLWAQCEMFRWARRRRHTEGEADVQARWAWPPCVMSRRLCGGGVVTSGSSVCSLIAGLMFGLREVINLGVSLGVFRFSLPLINDIGNHVE